MIDNPDKTVRSAGDEPFAPHPEVDPERDPSMNPFDNPTGLTGQSYTRRREEAMGRQRPGGHPPVDDALRADRPNADPQDRDIPPEAGRRGRTDPRTGEVHGSGPEARGGNRGEDRNVETPENA